MHISLPEPMEAYDESEEMQLARLQEKIDLAREQLAEGKGEPFTEETIKDVEKRGMARLKK